MRWGKIPVAEYERLGTQFNPQRFDVRAWVRLAKEAGQKYIVITGKHLVELLLPRKKPIGRSAGLNSKTHTNAWDHSHR